MESRPGLEFEALFRYSREGIFMTRPNGEILSANPEACLMLGRSEEEILALGRVGIINTEDPRLRGLIEERSRNGVVRGELTFKRADGSLFPVDFTSSVFEFEPGDVRTVIFFRDVTERKEAEERLRISEEKYRKLFDNSLVGVFSTTLTGEILYVNKALAELLEYDDISELSLKNISSIYKNSYDRERFIEILRRDRVIREAENTLLTANKREVNVSVSVVFNGAGFDGFVVDNTQRNNLHNELKRKNIELDHLNQTKDRFFSIISHDLRTPFSPILGFSEILTDELDSLSKEEIREYALNIFKSAKNTYDLLDNLLIWANSHSGDIVLKMEMLNLKQLIDNEISIAAVTAGRKGVLIENKVDFESCVVADKNTLKTVVRNLISNAVKYSNSGEVVVVKSSINQGNMVVSVSDNGIGMDSDTLNALFSRRDVVSRPGTSKEAGTGLGLVLCKEFVELNNGSIWAESREGTGSKLSFSLPLCKG
jgi:PAS domain S-box-containing protein